MNVITVNVKEEFGMFYATSQDLLGLHICGNTFGQTCETVIGAVGVLLIKNNHEFIADQLVINISTGLIMLK